MATELYIERWNELFENSRTRTMKAMQWVPVPIKFAGDGYTELMEHENGAQHYAVWVAMLLLSGACQARGRLVRDTGEPHDSRSLARITRIKQQWFDEAIPRLRKIGWLGPKSEENSTLPQGDRSLIGACEDTDDGMEGNGREVKISDASASSPPSGERAQPKAPSRNGRHPDPEAEEKIKAAAKQLTTAWNRAPGVRKFEAWNEKRRAAFRARMRSKIEGKPWLECALDVLANKFPLKLSEGRSWKPDIEFFLRPSSVLAIMEGKYDWSPNDDKQRERPKPKVRI